MLGAQPGFEQRTRRFGRVQRAVGHGIGVARHQHLRHTLGVRQACVGGGDEAGQVGAADHRLRLRVGDVVAELVGPVHRVHRHHHRVGAQDAVHRHDELRAVLHVQRDAVALFHTHALQPAGQGVGLRLELRVAQVAPEEDERRLVRVARGRDLQVEVQRGLRHHQLARQALGPDFVMGAGCVAHGRWLLLLKVASRYTRKHRRPAVPHRRGGSGQTRAVNPAGGTARIPAGAGSGVWRTRGSCS